MKDKKNTVVKCRSSPRFYIVLLFQFLCTGIYRSTLGSRSTPGRYATWFLQKWWWYMDQMESAKAQGASIQTHHQSQIHAVHTAPFDDGYVELFQA